MPCSKVDSWHLPHHLSHPQIPPLLWLPPSTLSYLTISSLYLHPQHPTKSRYNHRFSRRLSGSVSFLSPLYLPPPGKQKLGPMAAQGNQSRYMLEPEHEVERTLFTSAGWVSSNTVLKLPSFWRSP